MRTLVFKPTSVTELAAHVLPEFSPFTLLLRSNSVCANELKLNDPVVLELNCPDTLNTVETVKGIIICRFDVKGLQDWVAVAIPAEQQALIHRICYLCRQHTDEYGKLFSQLINDYCHSH